MHTDQLTKKQIRRRSAKRLSIFFGLIVVLVLGWFAYDQIAANLREQGELAVRNAILNSAKQCAAIEGAYPTTLYYLEQNYGLVVNRNDYVITYEPIAANVMPSVVVMSK